MTSWTCWTSTPKKRSPTMNVHSWRGMLMSGDRPDGGDRLPPWTGPPDQTPDVEQIGDAPLNDGGPEQVAGFDRGLQRDRLLHDVQDAIDDQADPLAPIGMDHDLERAAGIRL